MDGQIPLCQTMVLATWLKPLPRQCKSIGSITSLVHPHYPQSNGLAEKFVQTVKNLFYKAREEGTDLYKALMIYRNMPLTCNLQSPMQILQNRVARSQLPMSNSAKRQLGLEADKVRTKTKNDNFPLLTCI